MSDSRLERLQVMLTENELAALDDWRFAHRMPSRASAVRELLKRGLAAEGFELSNNVMTSKDYGVTPESSRTRKTRGGKTVPEKKNLSGPNGRSPK